MNSIIGLITFSWNISEIKFLSRILWRSVSLVEKFFLCLMQTSCFMFDNLEFLLNHVYLAIIIIFWRKDWVTSIVKSFIIRSNWNVVLGRYRDCSYISFRKTPLDLKGYLLLSIFVSVDSVRNWNWSLTSQSWWSSHSLQRPSF